MTGKTARRIIKVFNFVWKLLWISFLGYMVYLTGWEVMPDILEHWKLMIAAGLALLMIAGLILLWVDANMNKDKP